MNTHPSLKGKSVPAILLAGGNGRRMGGIYKQFLKIGKVPLICYSLNIFLKSSLVKKIIVVVPKNKKAYTKKLVAQLLKKKHTSRITVDVIAGGVTRRESAELAMSHLLLKSDAPRYIMFHDAARPLIRPSMISSVFRAVKRADGAVMGRTMLDLCTYAEDYFVTDVLQKGYTLQTPQCYVFKKLYRAYEEIKKNPNVRMFNDGTAIMKEVYPNAKIKIVITNALNLKLTHVEDGATVKKLL